MEYTINKTSVNTAEAITLTKPTKVISITQDYVFSYYDEQASSAEQAWMRENIARYKKEKGEVKWFPAFRAEFAKKFMPEILARKKAKGRKPDLLERMLAWDKAHANN